MEASTAKVEVSFGKLPGYHVRIDVRVIRPNDPVREGEPVTPVPIEELHQQLDAMLLHVRQGCGISTDVIDVGFAD